MLGFSISTIEPRRRSFFPICKFHLHGVALSCVPRIPPKDLQRRWVMRLSLLDASIHFGRERLLKRWVSNWHRSASLPCSLGSLRFLRCCLHASAFMDSCPIWLLA